MGNNFTTTEAGDLGDDLVGLLDTTYCTITELRRYLSAQGVTDFADHDASGAADSQVVADCINQATGEIDMYARQRYAVAGLNAHDLITRWCVVMSAYFLCQRRGNPVPDSILNEFLRITDPDIGFLAKVASGRLQLPGLALGDDLRPTWSNLAVDRRHRRSAVRVTKENSSDADTKLSQDVKSEFPVVLD